MRRPAVILVAGLFVVLGLQWWLSGRDLAVGQTWAISTAPTKFGRLRAGKFQWEHIYVTIGAITAIGTTDVIHVSVFNAPCESDRTIPYLAFSREVLEDAMQFERDISIPVDGRFHTGLEQNLSDGGQFYLSMTPFIESLSISNCIKY